VESGERSRSKRAHNFSKRVDFVLGNNFVLTHMGVGVF
jgi:hypothetical protein